jgi:hypothetical protein
MLTIWNERGGLGLLAARSPLYMGIALLAMAVCHRTVLAAFPMPHPRMVWS